MSAGGAQTSSRRRKGLQPGLPDDQPDYHAVISGVYAQNNTNPPLRMDCSVHIQRRVTQVISHAECSCVGNGIGFDLYPKKFTCPRTTHTPEVLLLSSVSYKREV